MTEKIKLSKGMDKKRNYDLKVIKGLKTRLNDEADFLELSFFQRAILICALKDFRKTFFHNDFVAIQKRLNKESHYLQKDLVHTKKIKIIQERKIELLKKENKELKEQIKDLSESLDIMNNRESELLEQIEKMKNMQNCKHNWETKGQCVLDNGGYCICDKWEEAE